ncbi:hypothetical protein Tco_0827786 [Tanacetum coccineum]
MSGRSKFDDSKTSLQISPHTPLPPPHSPPPSVPPSLQLDMELVPSCFVIFDLEPLSLSLDFCLFRPRSLNLYPSVLILECPASPSPSLLYPEIKQLAYKRRIKDISLTGFPAQSVGSLTRCIRSYYALLVLLPERHLSQTNIITSVFSYRISQVTNQRAMFDAALKQDFHLPPDLFVPFLCFSDLDFFEPLTFLSFNALLCLLAICLLVSHLSSTSGVPGLHDIAMADARIRYKRYFVVVVAIILEVCPHPLFLEHNLPDNAMYLPLRKEIAVQFWFFDIQLTSLSPRMLSLPKVLFRVSRHPA